MKMSKAEVPLVKPKAAGGILLPRCYVCNEVPAQGIHGGIRLNKSFICTGCEQRLILAEVGTAHYQKIIEKIKQILK